MANKKIQTTCPNCGNNTFSVIEVVRKPSFHSYGIYRTKCDACEHPLTAFGKTPDGDGGEINWDVKNGKVPKRKGSP